MNDRRIQGDVMIRLLRERNSGLARLSHQLVHRHAWSCWRSGMIAPRRIERRPTADVIRLGRDREAV